MSRSTINQLKSELRAVQKKHGDFESVELLLPDLNGVLKGKRVRMDDVAAACKNGFWFCGGSPLLTILGETVAGIPFGQDDGDPDVLATLVPGSIAPVPWSERPMGQALFRLYGDDGEPMFADPRSVLERALAPLEKMGLTAVMATELEFYLLDASAEIPTVAGPHVPGTDRLQPGAQVYHPDDLWEIEPFLHDVYDFCAAQHIPADTAIAEYSQGQFEINLKHVDDPVLACDHAVLLKRAIKAAARKHGFVACFMAKPFAEDSGNGLHIHMSLVDRNGKNYFSHGRDNLASPPFSARLRHAVGGLLKTMQEATAICAPNANSYRRLRPDMFAPVEPNWGVNHRVVAIRIPQSDANNLRFEHRIAGADANPYLVTAAVVAGVHYGLKNKCDPGVMVEQGEHLVPRLKIPNRWDAAIDKFQRSKILPQYLGKDYCKYFAMNRREESRLFHNTISQLDYDWYLR
ncbi:MAG: glutamine synthetase, partial [Gammaproteobacteria bacterium]|nr:glutamine synthetase [Gammaproteobacteria bacterium]